ncbi:hypothetical protein MYCTH_2296721 [Thermothelomyces thermophilus ATCC 42464]|uniref:Uncharacterized protein n=1 Tax=Thermothelomyces thermophilus (strain ATCC 42464 / BCRC 31852 / DSM 1799) TaxID=573729 RepID=G2Q2S5_THET4|nr:uncharacterized protein MYCTH_2296721 [Thermothelomyces thermophilus ATCC 42464]AEO54292.1 hypothetical protein MYCTH_2296721 [Thermothelomyces thermophilus ATCC 42464]
MEPQISKLGTKSALWLLFASFARDAVAHPYPRDDLHAAGYGYLMPRGCHQYCGYNNMFCCEEGTECYTYGEYAGCSSTAGGGWARFTTTWTLTQTFTSTYDSWIPATTAPPGSEECVPPEGSGWIACGKICCASWQYCASEDHCVANPGAGPAPEPEPTTVTSGEETLTTGFSAPYRVTSGTRTATATTATNSGAFSTTTGAVSPGGSDGGLSGGAIAGIVVGTIAGVALLLLICACCVARGLWHGLLAIFGLGKKDETSEEERYQRRGSHAHRESHGSWYGGRPSSAAARKEKSKGKGLLGLGAFLGMLALLLGLRREKRKEEVRSRSRTRSGTRIRSDVSSSYSSESYTVTSPSKQTPELSSPTFIISPRQSWLMHPRQAREAATDEPATQDIAGPQAE